MKEELDEMLNDIVFINEYKIFDLSFYECKYNDLNCILVESGIGKVNAARCTQILIDNMEVDYIFNVGVAGSVDNGVNICDIVIGTNLVQHDFDLTSFKHDKGYIPNVGKYINCDEYLIRLAKEIEIDNNVFFGTIASGDIFVTEKKMSEKISSKFNALCVEMEGASIAQVCYLSGIPFLVIRSISDSPNGSDNKLSFDEFLQVSSKTVATFMKKLLDQLQ